jgi:hypothetical protein
MKNVKQTVSLFEQANSLFYVLSDYFLKNHKLVAIYKKNHNGLPLLIFIENEYDFTNGFNQTRPESCGGSA